MWYDTPTIERKDDIPSFQEKTEKIVKKIEKRC